MSSSSEEEIEDKEEDEYVPESGGKKKKSPTKKKTNDTAAGTVEENGDAEKPPPPSSSKPPQKPASSHNKSKKSIESEYKKMSQLEHILARPDTYIGSIEPARQDMWVYDTAESKMVHRQISYVPGLYKIFDEILVNAADNKQRDPTMTKIDIVINPEKNEISILNDGKGIPVVIHKEHNIYVPTMIFGHLLTSSNYNDDEKKVTGGRNGYGAKLCNVYSTRFMVETSSNEYKKKFKQVWTNNMRDAGKPRVDDIVKNVKDFTRITFQPDLARFKMDRLDDDTVALLTRRAYDIAGTAWGVKVSLNGQKLPVKDFKDYVNLYVKDNVDETSGEPPKIVYEKVSNRWEIAVTSSDTGALQHVSFVNSISTPKGGKHVDHVVDPLADKLKEAIMKKNKQKLDVKPNMIKSHLWVFINCLIENPAFDSQTKELMTLPIKNFGSRCQPSEKFAAKVMKIGIVENIMNFMLAKAQTQMGKKLTSGKTNKIRGIPKLEDANDAGTKNSSDCTLILTEGDSAKALVVSGLSVVGRDKFGVFPLRGKLLNVRDAPPKQIMENAEIQAIIKILGLQYKKKYSNADELKSLRYGRVMIMTDQDADGSHIKGLLVNFFHNSWPGLLRNTHHRFLDQFITPIVKVTQAHHGERAFYSLPEFLQWKTTTPDFYKWKVKYYKGLGTSTAKEAKEYFADMQRHRIRFRYDGQVDDDAIEGAFRKDKVEYRKQWLTNGMQERRTRREAGLDEMYLYQHDTRTVTYADFINKELILFSNLDNERSIPSMVDGLKPGQRKVLFTCFRRNDKREVKVAQLAGSVAELSAYHHGEQSLMSTIVNLAQDYVGSNNVNLLMPYGQFGTRLQGGNDSASPRYIFTMLSPLARLLFPAADEPLLHYLTEDNQRIEPEWYCPILPVVLLNGADGIGTGWSTKIPNFNARNIVDNIRSLMNADTNDAERLAQVTLKKMMPWYRGFRGTIQQVDADKYLCDGEVAVLDDAATNSVEITELPVGVWTQNYKEKTIEAYVSGGLGEKQKIQDVRINDYKEYHTDTTVRFVVKMTHEQFTRAQREGFHNYFKLRSFINTTSMVLFDANGVLCRYTSVEDILRDFFRIRLQKYDERKEYLQQMLQAEDDKLSNQARFILEKISGDLKVENKKKAKFVEELTARGYDSDPVKVWKKRMEDLQRKRRKHNVQEEIAQAQEAVEEAAVEEDNDENGRDAAESGKSVRKGPDFDYLGQMAIYSLTLERKDELLKQRDAKKAELAALKLKTSRMLWNEDLDKFLEELKKQELRDAETEKSGGSVVAIKKSSAGGKGGAGGAARKGASFTAKAETRPSTHGKRVAPELDAGIKLKVDRQKSTKAIAAGRKLEKVESASQQALSSEVNDDSTYDDTVNTIMMMDDANDDAAAGVAAMAAEIKQQLTNGNGKKRPRQDINDDDDELVAPTGEDVSPAKKPKKRTLDDDDADDVYAPATENGTKKQTTSKKSSKAGKSSSDAAAGSSKKRKRAADWASDDDASSAEKSEKEDDDAEVYVPRRTSSGRQAASAAAVKKTFVELSDDDENDEEDIVVKPKKKNIDKNGASASSSKPTSTKKRADVILSDSDEDIKPATGSSSAGNSQRAPPIPQPSQGFLSSIGEPDSESDSDIAAAAFSSPKKSAAGKSSSVQTAIKSTGSSSTSSVKKEDKPFAVKSNGSAASSQPVQQYKPLTSPSVSSTLPAKKIVKPDDLDAEWTSILSAVGFSDQPSTSAGAASSSSANKM